MSSHESSRAVFYALAANLGIAVAKGIAAFITKSGSMMAEAIHSVADCTNQILLLIGMKQAGKPENKQYPLGYGRSVYFWSFIVAILLFSTGGLFSIYEGIHKLDSSEPVHMPLVALSVLFISFILESLSLYGGLKEAKKIRGEKSFFRWLKETRNSEIIIILGEDSAAVSGLFAAFIFVSLSVFLNMPVLDAVGSIFIGVILVIVSFLLILRMKSLLIGRSAELEIERAIKDIILTIPEIDEIYHLITVQMGPYIMLACKVKMKSDLSINKACIKINDMEKRIKSEIPEIKWSFIEPDVLE